MTVLTQLEELYSERAWLESALRKCKNEIMHLEMAQSREQGKREFVARSSANQKLTILAEHKSEARQLATAAFHPASVYSLHEA